MSFFNFPSISVAHSVLDADSIGRFVEMAFDIGKVENCQLWRSFLNDVYRISADGRLWWLRVHPAEGRASHHVKAEVEAVSRLNERGASVSAPASNRYGENVLGLESPEGIRMAVLFTHARGKELEYFCVDGERNAMDYGFAVAQLHDACDAVPNHPHYPPINLDSMILHPVSIVARHLDIDCRRELERISAHLVDNINAVGPIEPLFCHGDLNGSNVHFDGGDATVFDFDCCGWGSRAFELAAFARGVTWHGAPEGQAEALILAFLNGYRSHRTIMEIDMILQPTMLLAQRLWVTALHLSRAPRLGSFFFGQNYASAFVSWLRTWEPTLERSPDQFLQREKC